MKVFVAMCVDRGAVEEEDMEVALEEEDTHAGGAELFHGYGELSRSIVMEIEDHR